MAMNELIITTDGWTHGRKITDIPTMTILTGGTLTSTRTTSTRVTTTTTDSKEVTAAPAPVVVKS